MRATALPEVTDALIDTLATALPSVAVEDGTPLVTPSADLLVVGWSGNLNPADPYPAEAFLTPQAVASQTVEQEGLTEQRREALEIPCALFSAGGGTTRKSSRDALCELLADADEALRNDPTLGDVAARAFMGRDFAFYFDDTASGYSGVVTFTITVLALL